MKNTPCDQFGHRVWRGTFVFATLGFIESVIFMLIFVLQHIDFTGGLFNLSKPQLIAILGYFIFIAAFAYLLFSLLYRRKYTLETICSKLECEQTSNSLFLILSMALFSLFSVLCCNPDSFGHIAGYVVKLRSSMWFGILIGCQLVFFLIFTDIRRKMILSPKNILLGLMIALLLCVWYLLSREMMGRQATSWMGYFRIEDFQNSGYDEIGKFIREMRSGIPPLFAMIEIIYFKITGSTQLICKEMYRLALGVTYCITVIIFAKNILKRLISFLLSIIFISATILISAQNPEVYDIMFPCFLLNFLLFSKLALSNRFHRTARIFCAVLSGFFLSLSELARPFVFLLLPVILITMFIAYKQMPKRYLFAFILPLILISGGWHLKLLIFNDGQLFWSNHTGFNLYRAWGEIIEVPELVDEPQTWDRRADIHSQEHYENSKRIQRSVTTFIVTHPVESAQIIGERLIILTYPRTSFFDEPELSGLIFSLYRIVFKVTLMLLGVQLLKLGFNIFKRPKSVDLSNFQNMLLVITPIILLILAIGEKGEEARLVLSVLPFLAALPTFQVIRHPKR